MDGPGGNPFRLGEPTPLAGTRDFQADPDERIDQMSESGDAIPAEVDHIRRALLEWYQTEHRSYPWRETDDPYEILVSEVMSQQTQLDRILEPWSAFIERWPDIESLAAADRADVVAFWTGHTLGYNNRARYLHEAAQQVVEDFGGEFPTEPDELEALMGVGPYTANAVASFAFNTGDAVVDTNVKRVLYRAFDVPDDDPTFESTANELMPEGRSGAWNNAIMELGGVACTKSPACDEAGCPWRQWCHAYRTGDFNAPDVPTQSAFEGSRRQMRGRVVDVLSNHDELELDSLGPKVRVDYVSDDEGDRDSTDTGESDPDNGLEWLLGLLEDLEDDGLVEVIDGMDGIRARLKR